MRPTTKVAKRVAVLIFFLVATGRTTVAQTLTFEGIPSSNNGIAIPNGYGGFVWSNFFALDMTSPHPVLGTGNRCVVSGINCISNGRGQIASLKSATPFTFNSAYMVAWFNGALGNGAPFNLTVTGLLGATQMFQTTFSLGGAAATLHTFNWANIDELVFDGRTPNPGANANWLLIDNATFLQPSTVPEPGSVVLVGTGLVALLAAGRLRGRRRRST